MDILKTIDAANPTRSFANFSRRLHKLTEEFGEVSEAYLGITSDYNPKAKTVDDLREELADLLIVAGDLFSTRLPGEEGLSEAEFQKSNIAMVEKKLNKWQAGRAKAPTNTAELPFAPHGYETVVDSHLSKEIASMSLNLRLKDGWLLTRTYQKGMEQKIIYNEYRRAVRRA